MRKNLVLGLIAASLVVFGSTSASALTLTAFVQGVFTDAGLGTPTDYSSLDGGVTGTATLAPGHAILLGIEVHNAPADLITAIFASVVHDGSQLQVLGNQLPTNMLLEPGFGGNQLSNVNTGALKGNSPNLDDGSGGDVWIQGVSYALQAGTTGTGPDVISLLYVVGAGIGATDQIDFDVALTAGDSIAGAGSITLGDAVINVPEPGTALLMGLGLIGLAGAGRRSRS